MAWTDIILNEALRKSANDAIADGQINFLEMQALLQIATAQGITASELADLRLIYDNGRALFASDYLRSISYSVVYSNPANERWWGGATSLAGVSQLGNLSAGDSALDADRLVSKWFSGADWPMPIAGGDTATGKASASQYGYKYATGPLFVNGAVAADVNQGALGDCYLLAALGAIANVQPTILTSQFTLNPNGSYGVRFYADGMTVYTTVDLALPVSVSGQLAFAGNATKSLSGELWVSLVEKAYAQLNQQFDIDNKGAKWQGENSYQAIEGGFAQAIKQVANLNYKYYSSFWTDLPDSYDSGFLASSNPLSYKQTLIDALKGGAVGWLGSWGDTYGSNGKREFVSGHAFMLLGYNAATDKFVIRNPWGGDGSSNYSVQFEASIEQFWNSSVKGVVAVSDGTSSGPGYTYSLASSAASSATAVTEGQDVVFTITRSASGTASTVYLSTVADTAGPDDYLGLSAQPVSFAANELVKTVAVRTLLDGVAEGVESFRAVLRASPTDTASLATAQGFLKDAAASAYSYTVTTAAASAATAVAEGSALTFTVTRSGTGSESTVYVSTIVGTAGQQDFAALDRQALTFSAFESTKTVKVDTFADSVTEGVESLSLGVYRFLSDSAPAAVAQGFIEDLVTLDFDYSITSSAGSDATAAGEGSKVRFTIVREGSGAPSTVYLSTLAGTAGADDYVALNRLAVSFESNQTVATVDVSLNEDWWLEPTEYFKLALFKTRADISYATAAAAYIKDSGVSAFNYTIASGSATAATATKEGDELVFTITRSGNGATSTVYLETTDGTATNGVDGAALKREALTFADFETSKVVKVKTYTDSLVEGPEYLLLNLYRNFADPAAAVSARGYIDDPAAAASYTYTITTTAGSSGTAVTEGNPVVFTVTRSGSGTTSTVYVDTNTSNGTATSGVDYAGVTRQALTFAPLETSKTFSVATFQDSVVESPEFFYLLVFKNEADPFSAYAAYAMAYIKDPATQASYTYTLSSSAGTSAGAVVEGSPVSFTISRSGSGTASTVYVSTSGGTADNASDIVAVSRQAVEFASFETTKTITIATVPDSQTEGTEYFWLNLYKAYADSTAAASAAAYIKDPASVANYSYTLSSNAGSVAAAVTEGSPITFTIQRSGSGTASTVWVDTNTSNETATGNVDYGALTRQAVSFAANETTKTVTVNTYQDTLTEGTEFLYLMLFKGLYDPFSAYAAYTTAYIKDPAVSIDYSYSLSSNAGSSGTAVIEGSPVTFTITRSGSGSASTVWVDTNATNGTATNDIDFKSLTRQAVSFAANETSKTVTVNTFLDGIVEDPEYFYFLLYKNVADPFSAYHTYTTAYIKDPPAAANYSYTVSSNAGSAASAVIEGNPVSFTITRSGSGSASTVWVDTNTSNETATGNVDYGALTHQAVSFAANETTKTVTVNTYQDSVSEDTEFFYLLVFKNEADPFSAYAAYTTAYIKDPAAANYTYTLSSNAGSSAAAVTEGSPVTFTITRSGSGTSSTVYLDTNTTNATANGSDYAVLNRQPLTFAANETSKTITVNTFADSLTEGSEYFYLLLYKSLTDTNYAAFTTAYIKDPAPTVNYSYTLTSSAASSAAAVIEGKPVTITITRSGTGSASTVYIDTNTTNATANGSDYAVITKQPVTFAANETTKTLSINTFVDAQTEGTEYFYVLLFKSLTDTSYATYTTAYIRDFGVGANAVVASSLSLGATADVDLQRGLGAQQQSGAASPVPVAAYPGHMLGEFRNASAFAALRSDGSVVAWGDSSSGGSTASVATALDGSNPVSQIFSTRSAFAAVRSDGSVVAWGDAQKGGALDAQSAAALNGSIAVRQVYSSASAFAALRADGSVVTWGDANAGGNSQSVAQKIDGTTDVVKISSNASAFAAVRDNGSVVTWGLAGSGGDSSSVATALNGSTPVVQVFCTSSAFAALRSDGSLVTWGNPATGGNSSARETDLNGSNEVTQVCSTSSAFAALRADGSVVCWGDAGFGGDGEAAKASLGSGPAAVSLASTAGAFAAVRADGSVVSWGFASYGGDSSPVAAALNGAIDVVAVAATKSAFAALRADGSVICWGAPGSGGDSSVTAGALNGAIDVVKIWATDGAFAALRVDGSVVVWGDTYAGGQIAAGQQLLGGVAVREVYPTNNAFAAVRVDGTVVTWGDSLKGGDSSAVQADLRMVVDASTIISNQDLVVKTNQVGTAGDDYLFGSAGNDQFTGGAGNDLIMGGRGIDTAIYMSPLSRHTLGATSGGWSVSDKTGADGIDTLVEIERLKFSDLSVALDLAGNAGTVAKTLGAVFGKDAINNKSFVGIGLHFVDELNFSYPSLMELAINARLGANPTHAQVVDLLYTNVVGQAPDAVTRKTFTDLLDNGTFTVGGLGVLAADTALNQANINLTGLAQTGLEYLPFGG